MQNSRNRRSNQLRNPNADSLDMFQRQNDMFSQISKQMLGGSPFENDPFFSQKRSIFERLERDEMSMFGGVFGDFMNMEKMMGKMLTAGRNGQSGSDGNGFSSQMSSGGNGNMVMQTYCMSQSIGQDGKKHTQKYFGSNVNARGKDGTRFGEMQEMYHDSERQKKMIAQERTIDGQGRRIVKTKTGKGPEQMKQYYQGISEVDAPQFDNRWANAARSIGYNSSFGKAPNFAALGNGGMSKGPSNGLGYGGSIRGPSNGIGYDGNSRVSRGPSNGIGYGGSSRNVQYAQPQQRSVRFN